MGFFKEADEPVKISSRVYADQTGLYVHIPSHLRNRLEVVVGNRLEARLEGIESDTDRCETIGIDAVLEVKGYWHELYLPDDVAEKYRIHCNDMLHMTLYRIYQYDRVFDI